MITKISISPDKIAEFCRRNHIIRLSLFGSVLRDDFRPDSDVDVLVEFEPNHTPGLAIVDMEEELTHLFNHKADMVNPKYLNARIRHRVLQEAEVIYG